MDGVSVLVLTNVIPEEAHLERGVSNILSAADMAFVRADNDLMACHVQNEVAEVLSWKIVLLEIAV